MERLLLRAISLLAAVAITLGTTSDQSQPGNLLPWPSRCLAGIHLPRFWPGTQPALHMLNRLRGGGRGVGALSDDDDDDNEGYYSNGGEFEEGDGDGEGGGEEWKGVGGAAAGQRKKRQPNINVFGDSDEECSDDDEEGNKEDEEELAAIRKKMLAERRALGGTRHYGEEIEEDESKEDSSVERTRKKLEEARISKQKEDPAANLKPEERIKMRFQEFKHLEKETQKLQESLGRIETQINENEMVRDELGRVEGKDVIYRSVGPIMMLEKPKDAKDNIRQRLVFLTGEAERLRARIEEAMARMDEIRPELVAAQERMEAFQVTLNPKP
jgi:chaperonin cofactor prefoldin